MVPFDIQTLEKLDAAIQQVEAAIELFYAKRYAPAITLAGAAEGCLGLAPGGEDAAGDDEDIQVPEPLFELMKCGAMKQYGKTQKEVVARFNAARDWLKHETPDVPGRMELTNYDAWSMIVRPVTKIEAARPGSECRPCPASSIFRASTIRQSSGVDPGTQGHCRMGSPGWRYSSGASGRCG